jgi:protein O-GlcNAc transferase
MNVISQAYEAHHAQRWEVAEQLYQEALREQRSAALLNNLGNVKQALGKWEEAIRALEEAITLCPEFAESYYNLANVWLRQERWERAIIDLRKAIALRPDFVQAYLNLGNAQRARGALAAAVEAYQMVIQLSPTRFEGYYNLGVVALTLGYSQQARQALETAIALCPDYLPAYNNLGCLHTRLGEYQLAVRYFKAAIARGADNHETFINLGVVLQEIGEWDQAFETLSIAYHRHPEVAAAAWLQIKQQLCDWTGVDELATGLLRLVEKLTAETASASADRTIPPLSLLSLPRATTPAQQRRCAELWVRGMVAPPRPAVSAIGLRPLRIGYLSADYGEHPVAYLIRELFASHDRGAFQIYAYALGPDDRSEIRSRLVRSVDHFRDQQLAADSETAEQIRQDKIDILIDMQGHTRGARLEILAQRPAPLQLHYLGYPGSLGAPFIDYLIADEYVIPASQVQHFAEKILYLPGCYLVHDSQDQPGLGIQQRSVHRLPQDVFVFCAFSSPHKFNERMWEVWMRLLKRLPKSVLWLRDIHPQTTANLRQQARRHAVEPGRLIFAQHASRPDHLARQRLADLFLDTFPYNQHSTAADALRVGLPVITLSGEAMASRVAGSLLSSLGLPELITQSLDDYEARALQLASEPQTLSFLRERLLHPPQPLHDGRAMARLLEAAYRRLWDGAAKEERSRGGRGDVYGQAFGGWDG